MFITSDIFLVIFFHSFAMLLLSLINESLLCEEIIHRYNGTVTAHNGTFFLGCRRNSARGHMPTLKAELDLKEFRQFVIVAFSHVQGNRKGQQRRAVSLGCHSLIRLSGNLSSHFHHLVQASLSMPSDIIATSLFLCHSVLALSFRSSFPSFVWRYQACPLSNVRCTVITL